MGFLRQEYWSGLPFPSPGDVPDSGIILHVGWFFTDWATREAPYSLHIPSKQGLSLWGSKDGFLTWAPTKSWGSQEITHCKELGRPLSTSLNPVKTYLTKTWTLLFNTAPLRPNGAVTYSNHITKNIIYRNSFFPNKPATQLNLYFELAFPFIMDVKWPQILCS